MTLKEMDLQPNILAPWSRDLRGTALNFYYGMLRKVDLLWGDFDQCAEAVLTD